MKAIAYIHFHLKTGGVTTVLRHQVAAAPQVGYHPIVFSGEPPPENFPAPVIEVPELAYDSDPVEGHPKRASTAIDAIAHALNRHCPDATALIHVHNPTLAKNRQLQAILKGLAAKGFTLLCQIHDFAEDGRPDLVFEEPYVADCHYAVLNSRDLNLLRRAGLKKEGLHLLPNPVAPLRRIAAGGSAFNAAPPLSDTVLYPVRAIRRKNIGEALLLSLCYSRETRLALTLPPNSPLDRIIYGDWREFASRNRLPVAFEVGAAADFEALAAACRHFLSTSVTEGFGYAFLEPWTAGKALWGRLLPDICRDFSAHGVRLEGLYTRLRVPLQWLGPQRVGQCFRQAYRRAAQRFQLPLKRQSGTRAFSTVSREGTIDFGLLDERFQKEVIVKMLAHHSARSQLTALNPFLSDPGPRPCGPDLIERNRDAVLRHYSLERYAARLAALYRLVETTPVRQSIDKKVVQTFFMRPSAFSLLKWGAYHG